MEYLVNVDVMALQGIRFTEGEAPKGHHIKVGPLKRGGTGMLSALCIEHGAQVHTRGQHGSALEVGRAGGHDEVCDLLVQHAAVVRAGAATR